MKRTRQLKINTISSLLHQAVVIISGLILPRLILVHYGSEVNGLVSSINQFLIAITFLDLGVGSVVQASLYKPLVKRDDYQISLVLSSAKKYFRKIAYVLVLYVVLLIIFYPLIVNKSLDFLSMAFLIIAMSISSFSQYYFGVVNELLLNADQKSYVQLSSEIVTVLLNLMISSLLILSGTSIQIVKLISGLIYLIRPIYLSYYVNKNYNINFDIEIKEEPIKQKWHGIAQHIAYTVQNSTDVIVLTLFSTLKNVSIYSVYNLVISGMKILVISLTNGLKPFYGNLLANNEVKLLNTYFTKIEWLVHTLVVYLFGMTAALINPFVTLYTFGVNDADYYAPVFSLLLIIALAIDCLRAPYHSLILSAGHFKETQMSSIIEVCINVILSVLLVSQFGLVGVAIGTLCSMLYRTLYLVGYLSKNIVSRPIKIFAKLFSVDILCFSIMILLTSQFNFMPNNISEWLFQAFFLGIIFLLVSLVINFIFYKENMKGAISILLKRK